MKASRVIFRPVPPAPAAFTLVEVLVSMTVLSIIVIMLTSLLNSSLRTLNSSNSDQERHRSGRALTDFIGRELREAMLPAETLATSGKANLQLLINPAQIKSATDNLGGLKYLNADAIFWQAPLATETTYGDIAEIGYFVKWITTGAVSTPSLCRFFVNPSKVDPTSNAVTQNTKDFLIYTEPTAWLTTDLLDRIAPADNNADSTTGSKHGYIGLFAENVLGMWVQSYGINGAELSSDHAYDSRIGYQLLTGQFNNKAETRYLPALIKVSIAQIDSKYAARLSPAVSQIRGLVRTATSATDFLGKAQAATDVSTRALLPGIRVYSTDVFLENGR